ncbi:MAG TPA: Co2+/Mg2+ efflux protein ApaG [Candidatus Tenderia electrophaga]|uniref:Protein ApaG n=1 Tax=Candidatus Tenderia electrophaga TaxID=1748243 RepID=A0A832N342_9GAMM|nr:Co2+/Mg2+ efflux protein ApaG [Candidatus Tenderia electrophaga]
MENKSQNQINVTAKATYIDAQSAPEANRFVFAYKITIHNSGTTAAKLTHRHWHITDANGKEEEVHGEGVIGKQPYLKPGESFEYSSGTILETPVGAMQGHYDMSSDDGSQFKADIAPFTLSVPGSLH